MAAVYKSKTDTWLVAVLMGAMVLSVFSIYLVLASGHLVSWWFIPFTCAVGLGLPLWLLLSTHYTIELQHLLIQCGPLKWRIPLADINAITPTRNPLSSPALSLDRLRIDYGKGRSIMISPINKEQFLRDLEYARRIVG